MCINLNSPTLASKQRVSVLPEYLKPSIDFSSVAMTACLSFISIVEMIKYSDYGHISGERGVFGLHFQVTVYQEVEESQVASMVKGRKK